MATDVVRAAFTRAARKDLLRGGTVVEKSSLAPARISEPGLDSSLGATRGGVGPPAKGWRAKALAGGTAVGASAGGYAVIGG